MFGTYRLVLSLLVLLTHLGSVEVYAGLAVWAFFMLSGFLITGVLNTRYGFDHEGLLEFAFSRALRLLPTYWLSIALALIGMNYFNPYLPSTQINSSFLKPESFLESVSAIFIIGQSFFGINRINSTPSPSSWAVEVEIFLYIVSCLWLSRKMQNARAATIICIAIFPVLWVIAKYLHNNGFQELAGQLTYSFLPTALLPYSIGALLWFVHNRTRNTNEPSYVRILIGAASIVIFASVLSRYTVTGSYIASLFVFSYLTWHLGGIRAKHLSKRIDDFLGHMSYPVYLLHWIVAYALAATSKAFNYADNIFVVGSNGLAVFSSYGFGIAVLLTLILSAFIAWSFEEPIEHHRREWANGLASIVADKMFKR